MVIKYFIFFSPDGNGNPGLIFVSFFGRKERIPTLREKLLLCLKKTTKIRRSWRVQLD